MWLLNFTRVSQKTTFTVPNFGKHRFRQSPSFHFFDAATFFSVFCSEMCLNWIFVEILRNCEFLDAASSFLAFLLLWMHRLSALYDPCSSFYDDDDDDSSWWCIIMMRHDNASWWFIITMHHYAADSATARQQSLIPENAIICFVLNRNERDKTQRAAQLGVVGTRFKYVWITCWCRVVYVV